MKSYPGFKFLRTDDGLIVVISPAPKRNGLAVEGHKAPKGQRDGVLISTWVYPKFNVKSREVSESAAKAMHPELFAKFEAYHFAPGYAETYAIEMAAAIREGRETTQPSCEALFPPKGTRPVETSGPTGWTHHPGRR